MFDKNNMLGMLKQAQGVKKKIKKTQKQLDRMQFEGISKNGTLKAVVNGKMTLIDLVSLSNDEVDIILHKASILSAVNNAISKAQEETKKMMNSVTGGMLGDMKIPGI